MDKIEQARKAYRELGQMFFSEAEKMDAGRLADIQAGHAEMFWEEEIKRLLSPLKKNKQEA